MDRLQLSVPAFFSICLLFTSGAFSQSTFTIANNCNYPVWPGLTSNKGSPKPPTTGFMLAPHSQSVLSFPASWSGTIWGRTLCTTNAAGKFGCVTGDCRSGTLGCSGGDVPPATQAQITLDGSGGFDYYGVSLVEGFNVPLVVIPQGESKGSCTKVGCPVNINPACPSVLQDVSNGQVVACKSACVAFGDPRDCCTGPYNSPSTCGPTSYSEFFKGKCPLSASYAFDPNETFTCAHANYLFTFCGSI